MFRRELKALYLYLLIFMTWVGSTYEKVVSAFLIRARKKLNYDCILTQRKIVF